MLPGPGEGTSGQIARIRLENFMCHYHLIMDFKYAAKCYLVLLRTTFTCTGALLSASLDLKCHVTHSPATTLLDGQDKYLNHKPELVM